VYRVIEHILDEIGARKNSTAIIMDLEKGENKLSLYIDNRVAVDNMKGSSADFHTEHSLETTSIRERIYLSGGVITISTKDNSSVFYKIDWEI
jgi:glucose-6-phosphate-specific signal transduction histidine kinase